MCQGESSLLPTEPNHYRSIQKKSRSRPWIRNQDPGPRATNRRTSNPNWRMLAWIGPKRRAPAVCVWFAVQTRTVERRIMRSAAWTGRKKLYYLRPTNKINGAGVWHSPFGWLGQNGDRFAGVIGKGESWEVAAIAIRDSKSWLLSKESCLARGKLKIENQPTTKRAH